MPSKLSIRSCEKTVSTTESNFQKKKTHRRDLVTDSFSSSTTQNTCLFLHVKTIHRSQKVIDEKKLSTTFGLVCQRVRTALDTWYWWLKMSYIINFSLVFLPEHSAYSVKRALDFNSFSRLDMSIIFTVYCCRGKLSWQQQWWVKLRGYQTKVMLIKTKVNSPVNSAGPAHFLWLISTAYSGMRIFMQLSWLTATPSGKTCHNNSIILTFLFPPAAS